MTASQLLSLCKRVRSEVPLQAFALNCCVPETLSEVVLGSVSSTMASVTDNRHDQFAIFLVVGENAFEAITQVVELLILRNLRLEDARLNCGRLRPGYSVNAESALSRLEEVLRCAL